MPMIRPGFLSSADRLEPEACVRRQREDHGIARRANGLVALTFRSLNSFMRPFVRMPMGFCHLATSACGVCYKNH